MRRLLSHTKIGRSAAGSVAACLLLLASLLTPVAAVAETTLAVPVNQGYHRYGGPNTLAQVTVSAQVTADPTIDCVYIETSELGSEPAMPTGAGGLGCVPLAASVDSTTGLRYAEVGLWMSTYHSYALTFWAGNSKDASLLSAPVRVTVPEIPLNPSDPGQLPSIGWRYYTPPDATLMYPYYLPGYSALYVGWSPPPAIFGGTNFCLVHPGRGGFDGSFNEAGYPDLANDPGTRQCDDGAVYPPGSQGQWVTVYVGYVNRADTAWSYTAIPIQLGTTSQQQILVTAPQRANVGQPITVSGTVQVDVTGQPQVRAAVTLYSAAGIAAAVPVAQAVSDQSGRYGFSIRPQLGRLVLHTVAAGRSSQDAEGTSVRTASSVSRTVTVKYPTQSYLATRRAGSAVFVNALVKQATGNGTTVGRSAGRTVYLQRLLGGRWQNVLGRTTDANGTFAVGFIVPTVQQYRLVTAEASTAWSSTSGAARV